MKAHLLAKVDPNTMLFYGSICSMTIIKVSLKENDPQSYLELELVLFEYTYLKIRV